MMQCAKQYVQCWSTRRSLDSFQWPKDADVVRRPMGTQLELRLLESIPAPCEHVFVSLLPLFLILLFSLSYIRSSILPFPPLARVASIQPPLLMTFPPVCVRHWLRGARAQSN